MYFYVFPRGNCVLRSFVIGIANLELLRSRALTRNDRSWAALSVMAAAQDPLAPLIDLVNLPWRAG
jgi:hypothetical protein